MENYIDHKQNELNLKLKKLEESCQKFCDSYNITKKIISVTEQYAIYFEDAFVEFYLTSQKYQQSHKSVLWQGEMDDVMIVVTTYHMMFGNLQKSTGYNFKKISF